MPISTMGLYNYNQKEILLPKDVELQVLDYRIDDSGQVRAVLKTLPEQNKQHKDMGGLIPHFQQGGKIPGYGGGDKVPAMLEKGEFVVRKEVAKEYLPELKQINAGGLSLAKATDVARPPGLMNDLWAALSTQVGANAHKLLELIENEGVQEIGDWLKDQAWGFASNVPGIMDMIGNMPGMFGGGGIPGLNRGKSIFALDGIGQDSLLFGRTEKGEGYGIGGNNKNRVHAGIYSTNAGAFQRKNETDYKRGTNKRGSTRTVGTSLEFFGREGIKEGIRGMDVPYTRMLDERVKYAMAGRSFAEIQRYAAEQEKRIREPNNEYARDAFHAVDKLTDDDVLGLVNFGNRWKQYDNYEERNGIFVPVIKSVLKRTWAPPNILHGANVDVTHETTESPAEFMDWNSHTISVNLGAYKGKERFGELLAHGVTHYTQRTKQYLAQNNLLVPIGVGNDNITESHAQYIAQNVSGTNRWGIGNMGNTQSVIQELDMSPHDLFVGRVPWTKSQKKCVWQLKMLACGN